MSNKLRWEVADKISKIIHLNKRDTFKILGLIHDPQGVIDQQPECLAQVEHLPEYQKLMEQQEEAPENQLRLALWFRGKFITDAQAKKALDAACKASATLRR